MQDTQAGRPSRRREQADARREQLLRTALDVFARQGVAESTIKDLAAAAGVTEGLIYHYFESKSALLTAVIERFAPVPEMTSILEKIDPLPVREALTHLLGGLLSLYEERRQFMTLIVTETQRNPEVQAVLGRILAGGMELARQFVVRRQERGELRQVDPTLVVRTLQGPIFFYFLMQARLSPPFPTLDRDALVNGVVDLVLHGALPEPHGGAEERG